jgi:stress response protein SCP2/predicted type IV restriction endonuclease
MTKNVQLQRGASCLIKAAEAKAEDIVVELGWTAQTSSAFEVDACAFLLTEKKTVRDDRDFIFYNQPASADGSVVLNSVSKDSKKKSEFYISLSKLPAEIVRIVIAVTIYQAAERQQNFSMVKNLYLKIAERGSQIACYQVPDANEDITFVLGHIYRFQDEWKFCAGGQGFKVGLDSLAAKLGVDVQAEEGGKDAETDAGTKRNRRSSAELLEDSAQLLWKKMSSFLPQINAAVEQKISESNTRMILDRIFTDVLGYKIEELKAEQKIQGKRADYVLSADGKDMLAVEVKKAGMNLRDQHVSQAAFYGAFSGIAWALLTNLQTWQVYCITTKGKVEHHLVFSVDLSSGPSAEDFKNLALISREWISKRNLLEKLWNETKALRPESIVQAVLSEEVINKIRIVVNRDNGCSMTNEQIKEAVERILPAK